MSRSSTFHRSVMALAVLAVAVTGAAIAQPGPALAAGTVAGHVYGYNGAPVSGVPVTARWVAGGAPQQAGPSTTDANGFYSLSPMSDGGDGLVAAVVVPPALWGDEWIADNLTFSSAGTQPVDLRPGRITFTADRSAGSWGTWDAVIVRVHSSTGQAFTRLVQSTGAVSGYAWVMPGSVDTAVIKYWSYARSTYDEVEVRLSPQPVAVAGQTLDLQLQFDQDAAYRFWLVSPAGASGKPGTSVTYRYQGWPTGTRGEFVGVDEARGGSSLVSLGNVVSSGTGVHAVSFKVPLSATPGWSYYFRMYRPDNEKFVPHWIDLTTVFQVCTLKSSRKSVAAGGTIRLSGVVPWDRSGGLPGAPTTATVFRRTSAAGQPTNWAHPRGWTKVTTLKTNTSGAYRSGALRVNRTTWYVVRYPGVSGYQPAFTSVVKVTAR